MSVSQPPGAASTLRASGPPGQPHSGLGIVALVLAVVVVVTVAALLAVATLVGPRSPGGTDVESPLAILVGLALIGAILLELLALALGAVALCLPGQRRLFPLLAVVLATTSFTGLVRTGVAGRVRLNALAPPTAGLRG